MIISLAYDVEIFPNLFSITFIDLKDYFNTFKDCGISPLTDFFTVKEIKEKLSKVKSKIFWISDSDDSQLLAMVNFINSMEAKFEDGKPIRYDLFGYNNQAYDDMMIKAFMMKFNQYEKTSYLIKYLYRLSKRLIELQNDKSAIWKDQELNMIRKYRLPYATVDLFKVYALNSAGVNIDKEGNRNKFGKSLKMTSINLKWYELLDFTLPPIDEEEAEIYRKADRDYKDFTLEQISQLKNNDFDRYVLPKYIEPMLYYNKNDVFLVCEIARQKPEEIKLRYSLGSAFDLNLLCSARSNIADRLLYKFYSKMSGLPVYSFKELRTERTRLSFDKIIFPHICFKTKQLQDILKEMKNIFIYRTNKDAFCKEFDFYGTTYTLATGGLHSKDNPGVLKSTDKYEYIHYD